MSRVVFLVLLLAAGAVAAAPSSGLKNPFTTRPDPASDLKNPWDRPGEPTDPFATRREAAGGAGATATRPDADTHDLKDPFAHPPTQRPRSAVTPPATAPATDSHGLKNPFAPATATADPRNPFTPAPATQRPRRPPSP